GRPARAALGPARPRTPAGAPPLVTDVPHAQRRARAAAVGAEGDDAPALVVRRDDADDEPLAARAGEGDPLQRVAANGEQPAPVDEDDRAHDAAAGDAADAVDQPAPGEARAPALRRGQRRAARGSAAAGEQQPADVAGRGDAAVRVRLAELLDDARPNVPGRVVRGADVVGARGGVEAV